MSKLYKLKNYKFILVMYVLILNTLGVFLVGSASPGDQKKQIIGMVSGIIIMVILSLIDYSFILRFSWIIYLSAVGLLALVLVAGDSSKGAQRWFEIGGFRFQPSELVKILLIIFFSYYFMKHEEKINSVKVIVSSFVLLAIPLFLIYKQPNLSNTLCIAALFCILMYIGGLSYKFIGTALAIAIPAAIIVVSIAVMPNQPFLKEYQQKRILAWLEPEKYADDTAYQQQNSIMAIGSGQLKGKGLNNNTTTSVKNGNFLLEADTDFIFAIIGEELGFVGCCIVIILLLLIVIQCILIGLRAQNLAGRIICGGVAALIAIQSFINIGVATGVLPNTGLSLPFVSAGLTSIVCFYMGIGFVLNVGLQPKKYQ